jgi:hypothetical protein
MGLEFDWYRRTQNVRCDLLHSEAALTHSAPDSIRDERPVSGADCASMVA